MISYGIVGSGWRAEFYLRIAKACPDRFRVVGMTVRNPEQKAGLAERFGVKLFSSVEEMVKTTKAMFVVTSVKASAHLQVLSQLLPLHIPVLSETPPAFPLSELLEIWALAKREKAKIQVAEQYTYQPHHAARLALARSGKLGRISEVQVSVAHGYHGISLMRRFLGIEFENAKITVCNFKSPIVQGPNRSGTPAQEAIVTSGQTIAWLDFGDRLGVFDFTPDQYMSYIRGQRLLVRGERGEIMDDTAVYLQDVRTSIQMPFIRHSAGQNGNLEGNFLKGIQAGERWWYHNPLMPGLLSDEEIAIGTCLLHMADYVNGGQPFYSLAEACQDRYLNIIMEQAGDQNQPVKSETQTWG